MHGRPMYQVLLTILFMLLGAYAIAAQIYFIRELLVVFFGNELCLGIVFAGWFAGIWLGAALGARGRGGGVPAAVRFLASLVILSVLPFVLVPVMRLLRAAFEIPAGGYPSFVQMAAGTLAAVCPFSVLVGFTFPAACRVLIRQERPAGRDIGWVYAWESIGSLAGGLIISLVLIPRWAPLPVFGCGAVLLWAASFAWAGSQPPSRALQLIRGLLIALSAAGVFVLGGGALESFDSSLVGLRWLTFDNRLRLLENRESRYQNIVLAEGRGQYSLYANGTLLDSYPDDYESAAKAHFFLAQHPDLHRVLVIGGGMTGLVREVLAYPVDAVDYVELDPELGRLIRPVLRARDEQALDDSRLTISYMDGRRFVKSARTRYDIIIADTPDPSTALLNRFYTIDFFREIKSILSETGIFVTGISSGENYVSSESADYCGSVYRGLTAVFPQVMAVPGERTYFFAALQEGLLTQDPQLLAARYEARGIHSPHFSPALFRWLVDGPRIAALEDALRHRAPRMLNTDFHPITYFYNLVLWESISGSKQAPGMFTRIKHAGPLWVVVPVLLLFIAGAAALAIHPSRRAFKTACLWIIGTTGCSGMALEIVFIFMFQSIYGYIYEKIGIVVALFMLGLAGGGLYMRRRLKNAQGGMLKKELLVLEVLLCVYIAAVPALLRECAAASGTSSLAAVTEYFYFALICIVGLLTGMEFPLVCQLMIGEGSDAGSTAGWVDAIDHAGACWGAFLTGIFLVPLFGIGTTCLIMALLKVTGIGLLLLTLMRGLTGEP